MNVDQKRVSLRISEVIIEYINDNPRFHMESLREYISRSVGWIAPGSPDRILRSLRQQGKLNYRVLSRKDSLYQVIGG